MYRLPTYLPTYLGSIGYGSRISWLLLRHHLLCEIPHTYNTYIHTISDVHSILWLSFLYLFNSHILNYVLCSITGQFPISGSFTADQRVIYEGVLAAQRVVMEHMKPGVSWVSRSSTSTIHTYTLQIYHTC